MKFPTIASIAPSVASRVARGLFFFIFVVLAGCKSTIVTRVPEYDANEVMAVLMKEGISASKTAIDEVSFDVHVDQTELQRALEVLRENGLPREKRVTLGDLFKREGLVSTPGEERVRYTFGVAQELEKTLSRIDGVVTARVHVVIPVNDPLSDSVKPSSASVFVKHSANADPAALGPLIRGLVVRGIEGLAPENVSIAFVLVQQRASPAPATVGLMGLRIGSDSVAWVTALIVFPWLALIALSAFLLAQVRRSRTDLPSFGERIKSAWAVLSGTNANAKRIKAGEAR